MRTLGVILASVVIHAVTASLPAADSPGNLADRRADRHLLGQAADDRRRGRADA